MRSVFSYFITGAFYKDQDQGGGGLQVRSAQALPLCAPSKILPVLCASSKCITCVLVPSTFPVCSLCAKLLHYVLF